MILGDDSSKVNTLLGLFRLRERVWHFTRRYFTEILIWRKLVANTIVLHS